MLADGFQPQEESPYCSSGEELTSRNTQRFLSTSQIIEKNSLLKPATWDDKRDGKWKGRKAGPYEWYEIQDSTAYYPLFEKSKIVVQCIGYHSRWSLDTSGSYVNNKTFFIPTDDIVLLAILNSSLLWWYMWREFPHMKDEALSIDGQCVERLPIPRISDELADGIRSHTRNLIALTKEVFDFLGETSFSIQGLTGITVSPKDLGEIQSPLLLQRIKKNMGVQKTQVQVLGDLERVILQAKVRQTEALLRQLNIEKSLSNLVESAYMLTPEESELLRSTRPIRDPLESLEARIQGRADPNVAIEDEVEED